MDWDKSSVSELGQSKPSPAWGWGALHMSCPTDSLLALCKALFILLEFLNGSCQNPGGSCSYWYYFVGWRGAKQCSVTSSFLFWMIKKQDIGMTLPIFLILRCSSLSDFRRKDRLKCKVSIPLRSEPVRVQPDSWDNLSGTHQAYLLPQWSEIPHSKHSPSSSHWIPGLSHIYTTSRPPIFHSLPIP